MNIIILGAGQVGSTVAANLARESENEITIVDIDESVLSDLQDRLDVRTVSGFASHPSVLEKAGAKYADMIIAVTDSDETNMVACQIAYSLFHTPTKIARIRALEYIDRDDIFVQETFPVDVVISPEKLVTDHLDRLIKHPGAFQVVEFADDKVRLVGVRAQRGGLLVGHALRELKDHLPNADVRVAAIYRNMQSVAPEGDTVIQTNDEVFFIAPKRDIRIVMSELRKLDGPVRKIFIAGGGNIGYQLAKKLERTHQVKVIERDRERAKKIAEGLNETMVLCGDAADENLLVDENIDHADVFMAVTNSEEANILSSMLAKRLGAGKVMALINKPSYSDLVELSTIDVAVSPQLVTLSDLLAHVRRGDTIRVHSLRRGAAEAVEIIAHGDADTSKVVGRSMEEIKWPEGAQVSTIVRGDEVIMVHHDTVIETKDHVIIFMSDRKYIHEVEKLFQVNVSFN